MKEIGDVSITVIIPYYNSAKTIDRAIKSVLNQTFTDFEIIIINDKSTDEETQFLERYNSYDNIRLIHLDVNGGPAKARNIGMQYATGLYLAFLDSDDSWNEDKLSKQYEMMHEKNIYFSCHDSKKYNSKSTNKDLYLKKISPLSMLFKNYVKTRTVMIDRKVIDKEGCFFPEDMRYSEDYNFWLKLISTGYDLFHINGVYSYTYEDELMSGLSSNYIKMFKGELYTLWNQKIIKNYAFKLLLAIWSTLKFMRRLVFVTYKRKLRRS